MAASMARATYAEAGPMGGIVAQLSCVCKRMCDKMVITGLVAGSIALILAIGYARWLDDTVIADLVL